MHDIWQISRLIYRTLPQTGRDRSQLNILIHICTRQFKRVGWGIVGKTDVNNSDVLWRVQRCASTVNKTHRVKPGPDRSKMKDTQHSAFLKLKVYYDNVADKLRTLCVRNKDVDALIFFVRTVINVSQTNWHQTNLIKKLP